MKTYYVYILSSPGGTLYTGVTNNIWGRILIHKQKFQPGFTKKYNVTHLVYYEETSYIYSVLEREKQIYGWRRSKKIQLIDLAIDWYDKADFEQG